MPHSLLIAVRFSEGRYHGQGDAFRDGDGWPPSPARLFQALVAGAAHGALLREEDECALKWLEQLAPPRIAAPAARRGRSVKLFVPNNDLDAVGGDPARVSEIRVAKPWRPSFFASSEPVLYVWDFQSGGTEAARICSIASRLCQLGRGIDMAWASGQVMGSDKVNALLEAHSGPLRLPTGPGETATPAAGTLDSLIDRYRRKRRRLRPEGRGRKSRILFIQPPRALFAHTGYDTPARHLHFELRGPRGEFSPFPLASVPLLVAGLRTAATQRLQQAIPANATLFERLIDGRGAGPGDLPQRVRLLPVPSIGTRHTDPSIRRVTVEVPPGCPVRVDDLKWAFAGLQPHHPRTGEDWSGSLVSTEDSRMANRFTKSARIFRTITPAALPRAVRRRIESADSKDAEERAREEQRARGATVQALRHAGIRVPPVSLRVQREPLQPRGLRADQFGGHTRFSRHALWHVELRFQEAIAGPIVIGDGRFYGLGLMEPITAHSDVLAFNLNDRRLACEHAHELIRHLRRALMALARDSSGHVDRLFSGHESDGRSDGAGQHAHVFLAADGGSRDDGFIVRLIVSAPWAADRTAKPRRGQRRQFDEVTRKLQELTAGRLGRFDDLGAVPVDDGDPLLGPATAWFSQTPYVATRNLRKRDDPDTAIKADVIVECRRRGLPAPAEIDILNFKAGPRGGRPQAKLELRFAAATRGPLLLGRDSHAGGGLFHARVGERKRY